MPLLSNTTAGQGSDKSAKKRYEETWVTTDVTHGRTQSTKPQCRPNSVTSTSRPCTLRHMCHLWMAYLPTIWHNNAQIGYALMHVLCVRGERSPRTLRTNTATSQGSDKSPKKARGDLGHGRRNRMRRKSQSHKEREPLQAWM